MRKGKVFVQGLVLVACLVMLSVPSVMAQDICEGDLDFDLDVDADDVTIFLEDFGREPYYNPCPPNTSCMGGIPRTGQTTSYASYDDGYYEKGVEWPNPRFTNPDGTTPITGQVVLDQLTGLMWTKDADGPGYEMEWTSALTYITGMNAGAGTHGYTDWRLPNIRELLSLVRFGGCYPYTIDPTTFSNVREDYYWTSTTSACADWRAWRIDMHDGDPSMYEKIMTHYIWPVRGGR